MNTDTGVRKDEERLPWRRGWDPANPGMAGGRGLYIGPPSAVHPSLFLQLPLRDGTVPGAGRKDEDTGEGVGERERGSEREDEVEVGRKSRRDYPVATGAYKRIMLGRAGAEMPACKRNQFAIRYDPGNSGLA